MDLLNTSRPIQDRILLQKICYDNLSQSLDNKQVDESFWGLYIDGRDRHINKLEDYSAIKSFRLFSEYTYPVLILSPNSNWLLQDMPELKYNVFHIEIPVLDSHEKYSNFCKKEIWSFIPKQCERLLYMQSDAQLIKNGWEQFVLDNKLDFVGSSWCHAPSIDIYSNNEWRNLGFPRIQCGNGGLSYRTRSCCERVSNEYSQFILRESGREDNRPPPEDLFYSHIMNGIHGGGIVANIKQCMQFSLDPITLDEYNKKISFGFHYPKQINEFQKYRDYYLNL